jgi:uncharacterized RDD family membrane protein YckC
MNKYPENFSESLSERLKIDTPENVLLDAEIAGFGSRCAAALFDYVIVGLVFFAIVYIIVTQPNARNTSNTVWLLLFFVLAQVGLILYHLVFEFLMNGRTPGKMLADLRVVQANGLPVTLSGLLIRNLVRLFDFLPIGYLVGLVTLFATEKTQRLGDLAANTIVIRERKEIKLETLHEKKRVNFWFIAYNTPPPDFLDISGLSQEDFDLVIDYLQRRMTLTDRELVAPLLARRMARHMKLSENQLQLYRMDYAEKLLEYIAQAMPQT